MPRKVRSVTTKRGKKRKTKVRIGIVLPVLFVVYLLLAMIAGIWINGHFYALEKLYERAQGPPVLPGPLGPAR